MLTLDSKTGMTMALEANYTCPECGAKYNVRKQVQPMRDKDSENCSCGREIVRWNGGVTYYVTPVESEE